MRSTRPRSYVEAAGVRARYLAAADGLLSPVRHLVGLDDPVTGPTRHGLRAHFEVAPWTDLVEVHWVAGHGGVRDAGQRQTWWASPS